MALESEQKRREELEALVLSLKQGPTLEANMGTTGDRLPVQSDEPVEAEGIQIAASFAIDSALMHIVETRPAPLAVTDNPESHATSGDAEMQDTSPSDPKWQIQPAKKPSL